jgi:hypothetical protein
MQRRLALIHERLGAEGARSLNLAHLPPSRDDELIAAKLGQPPRIDWGDGRTGHLSWRAHRPVADWVTAYIDHQRGIDIELHRAIARLDARLREVAATLQDQQQANHAETLAALRRLGSGPADRR